MIKLTTRAAAAVLALCASAAWGQLTIPQIEQHSWPSISAGQSWSASLGSSSTLRQDDNSYADVYTYYAQAGETVTFTMRSSDVDSWIVVDEVNGPLYEHDDDSGGGHDAQLTVTFPRSGPYLVLANTVEPKASGRYSFSVARSGASIASNSSSSGSGSSSSDWAVLAQRMMDQMRQTFGGRGYSLADFEHDGQLGASGSERIPIHLSSGTNQLVGLCDNNCSDMDLELLDASGKIVGSDLEKDDFPMIAVTQSGDYSLLVKMVKCNSASCNYQLRVWRK
jgi:hypothetical protein